MFVPAALQILRFPPSTVQIKPCGKSDNENSHVARPTGLAFVEAEELSPAILDVNLRGEKLRFGGQAAGRRLPDLATG